MLENDLYSVGRVKDLFLLTQRDLSIAAAQAAFGATHAHLLTLSGVDREGIDVLLSIHRLVFNLLDQVTEHLGDLRLYAQDLDINECAVEQARDIPF